MQRQNLTFCSLQWEERLSATGWVCSVHLSEKDPIVLTNKILACLPFPLPPQDSNVSFGDFFWNIYFTCVCIACMYVSALVVLCDAHRGLKRASDTLELALWIIFSHNVVAGNKTQVLYKRCSKVVHHASSPSFFLLCVCLISSYKCNW